MAEVQYTFTHKQYTERHNNLGRVGAVPRLCELYPGICLITEEKRGKTSVRVENPQSVQSKSVSEILAIKKFAFGELYSVVWGGYGQLIARF